MATVLVAGATGQLGMWILRELKRRGHTVRALVRTPAKLTSRDVDEIVTGDLTAPDSLRGVCDGVQAVISCAGAAMNVNTFGDRQSFYDVDYQGNLHLLAEAQRAGVGKIVYVSLANGEQLRQTEYADAHEKFVDALRASGLKFSVVRPTGFFSFYLEILKFAAKGRGVVIGDGSCRSNPVHEADVAVACVEALESDETDLPVGGPDTITRKDAVLLAFEVLQRPAKLMSVSPGVFKLLIAPLKLFNRRIHALMDFGIAVTQVDVVAPVRGGHRLRDYFTAAAQKQ